MYGELTIKNRKILNSPSMYQPSKKVKEITAMVLKDFLHGQEIQRRPRSEFNDRTILEEIDVNQKAFNSYVPPKSNDPDDEWRAQTVRPVTRNKLISIAAHVTATVLYPGVFAQNANDEEDRDSAQVMRDLIEWVVENSSYQKEFIRSVIGMLVDPAVILHIDYAEVMRNIKEIKDSGYVEKKVVDEIMSGFIFNVIRVKELLIANFYEPNIQKQRFLIRNKYIDFEDARMRYGDHKNWRHIQPGVRMVFNNDDGTFYEVKDDEMRDYLVNEVTYYNRYMDVELCFINGILVSDIDQPLRRLDKKYPFAHGGYEQLGDGKCFYFKSAANKLGSDQDVVDTMYNMIIDGTYLALMPPMALYGSEDINTSVIIPGAVTAFRDPNTKMESIAPRSDIRAGLEAITLLERSMAESSQDNARSGVGGPGGERTAREVLLLEQNARVALGLFGKQVKFYVEDVGDLIIGLILQHMTIGEISELTDGMKFRTFMLPNKNVGGKNVTKKIKFIDPAGVPEKYDSMAKSFELMKEEGGLEQTKTIAEVNPELFRTLKYKARVTSDEFIPMSKSLEKALNLEAFDRLIQLQNIDQDAVTRDFLLDVYRPGEGDKYLMQKSAGGAMPMQDTTMGGQFPSAQQPTGPQKKQTLKGVNQNLVGQMTGSNSLGVAASSAMQ